MSMSVEQNILRLRNLVTTQHVVNITLFLREYPKSRCLGTLEGVLERVESEGIDEFKVRVNYPGGLHYAHMIIIPDRIQFIGDRLLIMEV